MGKKTRAVSGRRPILQLSPPGPRAATREEAGSGSDEEADSQRVPAPPPAEMVQEIKPTVVKPTGGLCLLGAYTDSDDEDVDAPEKPKTAPAAKANTSADIDSTLANFLAEIDAITAPTEGADPSLAPPPTPPKPDPKDSPSVSSATHNGADTNAAGELWHYDTQCSLAGVGVEMGDWQEVWDENTGCYYYWNTQSNEVTWELPQWLATQVQGAQGYTDRTEPSDLSSTVTSETVPEVKEDPTSSSLGSLPVISKLKKEVNEGLQALTHKEEERVGVAASLLAPLLPDAVKEEEERWRRRVVCKEEAAEAASEDDDDMAAVCTDSEGNADEQAQDGICSTVQSEESEEEVEEQDNLELERVLERKRAELRALEEGDVSLSGSSPRSDFSQTDEAQKAKPLASKWKVFVPVASPESNSRSSCKTGRDTPETEMGAEAAECPVSVKMENDPVPVKTSPKLVEEDDDLKFQIGELVNNLISKLEFLGITRQSLSNFHILLVQTETRVSDWREGALTGNYLKRKLQDASEQIKQYEINATPKGWSCHWDRDLRRYFYVNEISGESQWEFPEVEENESSPQNKLNSVSNLSEKGKCGSALAPPHPPPPDPSPQIAVPPSKSILSHFLSEAARRIALQSGKSMGSTSSKENTSESTSTKAPSPSAPPPPSWDYNPQPPLPLEAPLPPPPPPPPESPPPPPPPPLSPPPPPPPLEEDEIQEVEMEDDSNMEPPVPGTEEVIMKKPSSEAPVTKVKAEHSAGKSKRKAIDMFQEQSVTIGSCPVLYTQQAAASAMTAMAVPTSYLGLPLPSAMVMSSLDYTMPTTNLVPSVPLAVPQTSMPTPPAPEPSVTSSKPQPPPSKPQAAEKPKKVKKLKVKKSKVKMPSLVQKWQSIQKELDEEENSSSSDEDRGVQNQKRIDEWKIQQLSSGMAGSNANFEPLSEDWRERLKRRKMASST